MINLALLSPSNLAAIFDGAYSGACPGQFSSDPLSRNSLIGFSGTGFLV